MFLQGLKFYVTKLQKDWYFLVLENDDITWKPAT